MQKRPCVTYRLHRVSVLERIFLFSVFKEYLSYNKRRFHKSRDTGSRYSICLNGILASPAQQQINNREFLLVRDLSVPQSLACAPVSTNARSVRPLTSHAKKSIALSPLPPPLPAPHAAHAASVSAAAAAAAAASLAAARTALASAFASLQGVSTRIDQWRVWGKEWREGD